MVKIQTWKNEDGQWCALSYTTFQAFYSGQYGLTDSLRIFW